MVSGHPGDGRSGTMPVLTPEDYEPPSTCGGCGGTISDRYYLQAVDQHWHMSCLTCCRCKVQLNSELTCYARDGHIYCKEDYYRLYPVKRCARCQRGIFANELVMRARELVFHLHCFTCAWCNAALTQGDYFGLREGMVYCQTHYEQLAPPLAYHQPGEELPRLPHPGTEEDGASSAAAAVFGAYPACVGVGRKGRPRKRKNGDLSASDPLSRQSAGLSPIDPGNLHPSHLEGNSASQSSPPLSTSSTQRTKRMRTSFKHHQLRTMKSYFAINQNPDAKDLKQLAQKTGLSKRVLQVWFQNARAKWRRNNMKQQDSMSGIMQTGDQPSTPQIPQMSHGMSSPGANSSFSEPSPVHSCSGVASDGSISTHVGQGVSADFDSSNPLTPLMGHHGLGPGSMHNGDVIHVNFHELF